MKFSVRRYTSCARECPAPRVELGALIHFRRPENAVLALDVRAAPDLTPLHDALSARLRASGLPADSGPFRAHITLARHARVAPDALSALPEARGAFLCPRAHVFLSARDAQGVLRYTPLEGAPFGPSR